MKKLNKRPLTLKYETIKQLNNQQLTGINGADNTGAVCFTGSCVAACVTGRLGCASAAGTCGLCPTGGQTGCSAQCATTGCGATNGICTG